MVTTSVEIKIDGTNECVSVHDVYGDITIREGIFGEGILSPEELSAVRSAHKSVLRVLGEISDGTACKIFNFSTVFDEKFTVVVDGDTRVVFNQYM